MAARPVDNFELNETTSLLRRENPEAKAAMKKPQNVYYAIALAVVTGLIFFVVSNTISTSDVEKMTSTPGTADTADPSPDVPGVDIDTLSLHMTINIDPDSGLAVLVDRAPVACRHSSMSKWFTCAEDSTAVLGTAEYKRNVNDNGWNYLSIEAMDMRELIIEAPPTPEKKPKVAAKASHGSRTHRTDDEDDNDDKNDNDDHLPKHPAKMRFGDLIDKLQSTGGDLSPVRKQYVRTMHGIGLLEGYLSCKEIGEWYANFYDGLFEGGEVNRPTMEFLEQNHVWMNTQAALYWEVDEYWMVVKGILSQLEGLLIGAQHGCPGTPLDDNVDDDAHSISDYKGIFMPSMAHGVAMQHLLLMNANGDMFQIMQKYPANVVETNVTKTGRYGDGTIDTTPTVDDYVDDYTIKLSHKPSNNTTTDTTEPGNDEAYAYGDVLDAEVTDVLVTESRKAQANTRQRLLQSTKTSRLATAEQRNNPKLFYKPRGVKLSDIPLADGSAIPTAMKTDGMTPEQIMALPNIGKSASYRTAVRVGWVLLGNNSGVTLRFLTRHRCHVILYLSNCSVTAV
jgi:hypothetical protein